MNVCRGELNAGENRVQNMWILQSTVILVVLACVFYSRFFKIAQDNSSSTNLLYLLICTLLYGYGIIQWISMGNHFVSLYMMYYLYMFLSNTGQEIIFLTNKSDFKYAAVFDRFSVGSGTQWLLFQCMCVAAINLGAALATKYVYRKKIDFSSRKVVFDKFGNGLMKSVYYMAALSMLAFSVSQLVQRRGASYADYYASRESGVNAYAAFIFSVGSFYYLLNNKESWKKKKKYLYIVLSIIAMVFLAGTRSVAIPLVGCVVFCLRQEKPDLFDRKYIPFYIFGIMIGMYGLNVISTLRTQSLSTLSLGQVFVTGFMDGVLQMIFEMGISMLCGLYTMQYVLQTGQHYPTFLFYGIRTIIPGPILNMIGFYEPECGRLSDWVSSYAGSTYSIGYSGMAESIMNYGTEGWIFFLVYGFIIVLLELIALKKMRGHRYLFASVALTFLAKQIFFARAQFDLCTTTMRFCWMVCFVYYVLKLSTNRRHI